jgi:hypothetical protein
MMPEDARVQCKKILGNFAHSYHTHHGIRGFEGMTLGAFAADVRGPPLILWSNLIAISERGIQSRSAQ